jgi:hypothetical protein
MMVHDNAVSITLHGVAEYVTHVQSSEPCSPPANLAQFDMMCCGPHALPVPVGSRGRLQWLCRVTVMLLCEILGRWCLLTLCLRWTRINSARLKLSRAKIKGGNTRVLRSASDHQRPEEDGDTTLEEHTSGEDSSSKAIRLWIFRFSNLFSSHDDLGNVTSLDSLHLAVYLIGDASGESSPSFFQWDGP